MDIDDRACRLQPLTKDDKLFKQSFNTTDSFIRSKRNNYLFFHKGYMDTAILLLDQVEMSNNNLERDSYIIPAIYCFRHYIELTIKDSIYHFSNKKIGGHSLLELWEKLYPCIECNEEVVIIDKLIKELDSYDKNGTAFRYDYNLKGKDNSLKYSDLVDVNNLRTVMLQMYRFFDGINDSFRISNEEIYI